MESWYSSPKPYLHILLLTFFGNSKRDIPKRTTIFWILWDPHRHMLQSLYAISPKLKCNSTEICHNLSLQNVSGQSLEVLSYDLIHYDLILKKLRTGDQGCSYSLSELKTDLQGLEFITLVPFCLLYAFYTNKCLFKKNPSFVWLPWHHYLHARRLHRNKSRPKHFGSVRVRAEHESIYRVIIHEWFPS